MAYEDGSQIGMAKDHAQWQTLGSSARVKSVYNEKPANFQYNDAPPHSKQYHPDAGYDQLQLHAD